jgi:hypothetical protein
MKEGTRVLNVSKVDRGSHRFTIILCPYTSLFIYSLHPLSIHYTAYLPTILLFHSLQHLSIRYTIFVYVSCSFGNPLILPFISTLKQFVLDTTSQNKHPLTSYRV